MLRKKRFLNTFIESVEIFKEEQPNGRLLKCINFKFPVFYDGDENVTHIRWDSETTVESVALLTAKDDKKLQNKSGKKGRVQ